MKELKLGVTDCKGWAKYIAQLTQKKQTYAIYELNFPGIYEGKLVDSIIPFIYLNDSDLTPFEVDFFKTFNDLNPTAQNRNRYKIVPTFIKQRIKNFGICDNDVFIYNYPSISVYLTKGNYSEFTEYLKDILNEASSILGRNFEIEKVEMKSVNIPKCDVLVEELAYDIYGNKFEVGDIVARTSCGISSCYNDIIIGNTDKTLTLMSGGNCYPQSCFVVKKAQGDTKYMC